ncbi:hypothetical protein HYH03_013399, partial [Edaphochlamys debaryana]
PRTAPTPLPPPWRPPRWRRCASARLRPPRVDADRKGATATSIDVVFNEDILRAAQGGEAAQEAGAELDPRYKLPKMRYKGEVVATQRIRADDKRKALVTVLPQVEEEPSFALRTKKAPAPPPVGPAAPTTSTAATLRHCPCRIRIGTAGSAPPAAAAGAGRGPAASRSGQRVARLGGGGVASAAGQGRVRGAAGGVDPGVRLVVRLPYRSLDEHLADARAQAPLAFGQLGLASSSLLELEP